MDVFSISDSIMYDKLKEELTVRCNSLETNMATLVMIDLVHEGIIPNEHVADGITYERYVLESKKKSVTNYRLLQSIKQKYDVKNKDYGGCITCTSV
jgi:hypothetical protein